MDKNISKKSGFNRLRTITNSTIAAGAAVIAAPMMPAHAGSPNSTVFNIIVESTVMTSAGWDIQGGSPSTCANRVEGASAQCSEIFKVTDAYASTSSDSYGLINSALGMAIGLDQMEPNDFSQPIAEIDNNNNTVTSQVATNIIPGVDAEVQFRFYEGRALARALYTFTNTTNSDISANVYTYGDLDSDENTKVEDTSDGDDNIEDHDYWSIASNQHMFNYRLGASASQSFIPHVTVSRYGEGAQVIPSTLSTLGALGGKGGNPGNDEYTYRYDIIIPANSTVHLVSFVEMNPSLAAAQTSASDLSSASALQRAGLIDDAAALLKGPVLNYGINGNNAPSTPSSLDKVDAATNSTGAAGITLPGLGVLAGLLMARRRRQK